MELIDVACSACNDFLTVLSTDCMGAGSRQPRGAGLHCRHIPEHPTQLYSSCVGFTGEIMCLSQRSSSSTAAGGNLMAVAGSSAVVSGSTLGRFKFLVHRLFCGISA